jgi:hypothetical protein
VTTLADPPIQSELVEIHRTPWGKVNRISRIWEEYFRSRDLRIGTSSHTDQYAALTTPQTASIGITPIVIGANRAKYRVNVYLQQTITAGTSASFQVIIRWTSNGVNLSKSTTALTTNTTGSVEAFPAFMVRVDPGTNITYEVVYASVPAAQAAYILDIVVEAVG